MEPSTCCAYSVSRVELHPTRCSSVGILVNFGPFIAYTNIDTESLNILREYINDVMKWVSNSFTDQWLTIGRWMIREQKRLFVKEYETTTTQYQNLSRT